MTKEQILSEALHLDPRERDEIAETLWQASAPDEFSPDQRREIHRRIAALDNGEIQSIPGEHVMMELRRRFQK